MTTFSSVYHQTCQQKDNQYKQLSLILLIIFYSLIFSINGYGQWTPIVSSAGMDDFLVLNGTAEYEINDGVIIGTTKMGTPNTFLTTKRQYSDFILEFEVILENGMNSGVQFRSNSIPAYQDGRVHGYQCELETSDRRWAGGIYDESRRGWLYPLANNKKGQYAFKPGQWNMVRIEAIGPNISTFINGVQCSKLVDDMTSEGFIGLQVHSISTEGEAGKKVKWKNLRIATTDLGALKMKQDPEVEEISYLINSLTKEEKRNGWRLLWDGKTTNGWVGAKLLDRFPAQGWTIEDENLIVLAGNGGESTNGGDIITIDKFANFELELEFKITEGANSGIKYFVDPFLNKGAGSAIGLEFQILDDERHPDARKGTNGNRTVGSLYDLIPAGNLSEDNRSTKRFNGVNRWNKARIISKNGKIEHWLNGVKVVEYDRHAQIFKALVDNSKYKSWPEFGQMPEGNILLQDHGDRVAFRSIKVREL